MKRLWTTLGLIVSAATLGCTYERVVVDHWAPLQNISDSSPAGSPARGASKIEHAGWSILLERFEGKKHRDRADRYARRLAESHHIPDVWVFEREDKSHVMRGRYVEPTIDAAVRDLRQTRLLQIDGERVFRGADLISLISGGGGEASGPLDLRQHVGSYTLQIGFYDSDFGPDFRKAAEKAAKALRDDGDEAFFYHGPNRSLVTVGIFTDDDFIFVGGVQDYGPRILEIQKKYPYNLGNGVTLIEKRNGVVLGEQPSAVVKVE